MRMAINALTETLFANLVFVTICCNISKVLTSWVLDRAECFRLCWDPWGDTFFVPAVTQRKSKCNVSVEAANTSNQLAYNLRALVMSTAMFKCVYV